MATERRAEERALAKLLACRAAISPWGFVRLNVAGLDALPMSVLGRVLATVSGRPLPPRRKSLAGLARALEAPGVAGTLHGCWVRRCNDEVIVVREPAAITDDEALFPGTSRLWDRRFAVALAASATPLALRALGREGRRLLGHRSIRIPGPALLGLPSLWDGEQLVWHPLATSPGMRSIASCRFVPVCGLADAPFV